MLGINLADYHADNFNTPTGGSSTPQELSELAKALEAGQLTGGETRGSLTASGGPLKVESLDSTLKHLTFKESDIVFWKMIPKSAAYNTVEEFNQLVSYGAERGGFNLEGELPQEEDSIYRRMAEHVKFLGVTKSVTHPMQLVRTQPGIGEIVQREVRNGTMWILRKADAALAYGDSKIVPQEWNGLYAQHRNSMASFSEYMASDIIIDLRGNHLTEEVLENAANVVIENHGFADTVIAPPVVLTDFVKDFLTQKLIMPNTAAVTDGNMGQRISRVSTQFGDIKLEYDKFLKGQPSRKTTSPATSPKAPPAITPTATASPADASGPGLWLAGDAGDYYYAVAPLNRYGEGPLTVISSTAETVAAGDRVDLTFTDGGGANPATAYVIYRSAKNEADSSANATYYPLFSVSVGDKAAGYDGAAAGAIADRNRWLPACEQAYVFENSTEVMEFKQLAPLMKMDLAILAPATRFMILLYGTPQLFAPAKTVRIINIGRWKPA